MNVETYPTSPVLTLDNGWQLSRIDSDEALAVDLPFDVHSALLAEGRIADPYRRDNEIETDWVHEGEWLVTRDFDHVPIDARYSLTLDGVVCHAVVSLNEEVIGQLRSRFMRYDLDVTEALQEGRNRLEIPLLVDAAAAVETEAWLVIDGQTVTMPTQLWPGQGRVLLSTQFESPRL